MTDSEIIEREDDHNGEENECKEACKICCCCCYDCFWDVEKYTDCEILQDTCPECYNKLMCICCLCCICRTIKKRKQAKVDPSKKSDKSDKTQVVEAAEIPSDVVKDQPKISQYNIEEDEISEINSDTMTEKKSTDNKKERGQNRRQNRRI